MSYASTVAGCEINHSSYGVCLFLQAMDASAEERSTVSQVKGTLLPITKAAPTLEKVAITADMKVSLQLMH